MDKSMIPQETIEQKIFVVRGRKVMLDRDLAALYGVETRALNQAVRRNRDRFPEDFMFSLTRTEIMRISQIVICSRNPNTLKFSKNVLAFTEQGVAMLSSILNSKRAVHVNIQIMRAFTRIREMLLSHKDLQMKIELIEKRYDHKFKTVFDALRRLYRRPKEKVLRVKGFIS